MLLGTTTQGIPSYLFETAKVNRLAPGHCPYPSFYKRLITNSHLDILCEDGFPSQKEKVTRQCFPFLWPSCLRSLFWAVLSRVLPQVSPLSDMWMIPSLNPHTLFCRDQGASLPDVRLGGRDLCSQSDVTALSPCFHCCKREVESQSLFLNYLYFFLEACMIPRFVCRVRHFTSVTTWDPGFPVSRHSFVQLREMFQLFVCFSSSICSFFAFQIPWLFTCCFSQIHPPSLSVSISFCFCSTF